MLGEHIDVDDCCLPVNPSCNIIVTVVWISLHITQ